MIYTLALPRRHAQPCAGSCIRRMGQQMQFQKMFQGRSPWKNSILARNGLAIVVTDVTLWNSMEQLPHSLELSGTMTQMHVHEHHLSAATRFRAFPRNWKVGKQVAHARERARDRHVFSLCFLCWTHYLVKISLHTAGVHPMASITETIFIIISNEGRLPASGLSAKRPE